MRNKKNSKKKIYINIKGKTFIHERSIFSFNMYNNGANYSAILSEYTCDSMVCWILEKNNNGLLNITIYNNKDHNSDYFAAESDYNETFKEFQELLL